MPRGEAFASFDRQSLSDVYVKSMENTLDALLASSTG